MSRSLHQVYCYNPTVCVVCGAEVSSPVIQHVGSENASNYESDKNKHWLICKGCSKPISMDVHYAHCDDTPGICIECGFPNVQDITHDYLLFGYDDVCHWEECQICGAKTDIEAHLATCGQPGICAHCHAEYNGNNIEHDYASTFEYDENYHWITCINCLNSITLKERHAVSCTAPILVNVALKFFLPESTMAHTSQSIMKMSIGISVQAATRKSAVNLTPSCAMPLVNAHIAMPNVPMHP